MSKSTLFRYGELEFIASGGMAQVYACDRIQCATGDKHRVAVKQMRVDLDWTPARVERFNLECKILNSLASENIVHCYGIDNVENKKSIVMEYVACTLEDIISLVFEAREQDSTCDGTQSSQAFGSDPSELNYGQAHAIHLLRGILQALKSIETFSDIDGKIIRLVHRDLKPSNVLVTPDGVVKLADFGVSKIISQESRLNAELKLTEGGVGTISYRAPEQVFAGQDLDCRADLYSAGAIAFELLTGKVLFSILPGGIRSERDHREVLDYLRQCPEELAQLVCKLVRRDREERPRSASLPLSTLKNFGKESVSLQLGALVEAAVSRKEGKRKPTRIEAKPAEHRPTHTRKNSPDTQNHSSDLSTPFDSKYRTHSPLDLPREWMSRYPKWFKIAAAGLLSTSFAASLALRHMVFPPTDSSKTSPAAVLPRVASITVRGRELATPEEQHASHPTPRTISPQAIKNSEAIDEPGSISISTDSPTLALSTPVGTTTEPNPESDGERKILRGSSGLQGRTAPKEITAAPAAKPKPRLGRAETPPQTSNSLTPLPKRAKDRSTPSTSKKQTSSENRALKIAAKKEETSVTEDPVAPEATETLRALWCKEIQQPFSRHFAKRFPFRRKAAMPASPAKLRAFLHPSTGQIWKQLQAFSLQHDHASHEYRNAEQAQGKALLSTSALEFLRWLRILALSLYPTQGSQFPPVHLSLSPGKGLAKASLRLGTNTSLVATPGRAATLRIASALDLRQVSLLGEVEVRGRKEEIEFARAIGPWALLRVLELADLDWSEGLHFQVRWTKSSAGTRYAAKLGVESKRKLNPLLGGPGRGSRGLLQSFRIRPPKRPFLSGPGCP